MFQMGGVGPMMGQANVFFRYAPEKIPYAISATERVPAPLRGARHAAREREYLAGDYSIADIATWPWVRIHFWADVSIDDLPHLTRWREAIRERGRPSSAASWCPPRSRSTPTKRGSGSRSSAPRAGSRARPRALARRIAAARVVRARHAAGRAAGPGGVHGHGRRARGAPAAGRRLDVRCAGRPAATSLHAGHAGRRGRRGAARARALGSAGGAKPGHAGRRPAPARGAPADRPTGIPRSGPAHRRPARGGAARLRRMVLRDARRGRAALALVPLGRPAHHPRRRRHSRRDPLPARARRAHR